MQASLPSFVEAVKIDDFTIGKNALRIVSMRALPDQPTEKDYPKEEWIDQVSTAREPGESTLLSFLIRATSQFVRRSRARKTARATLTCVHLSRMPRKEDPDVFLDAQLDQTGDYVNFEVSFAYFAPPGTKKLHNEVCRLPRDPLSARSDRQLQNISLIIAFFLGAYDWLHIPVPIWIAVESICGTVRLRLQMVSEPPFIRAFLFRSFSFAGSFLTPRFQATAPSRSWASLRSKL